MADVLKEFWGLIAAAFGVAAWMIRLESKIALNTAGLQRLEQQRHEDLVAAREARVSTNDGLREIRSDLSGIRQDIKELIRAK